MKNMFTTIELIGEAIAGATIVASCGLNYLKVVAKIKDHDQWLKAPLYDADGKVMAHIAVNDTIDKERQANITGRFLLNSTDVNTIYQFVLETRYLSPDLAEKLLSRIDELKRDSK
jgi:hypothetical protein